MRALCAAVRARQPGSWALWVLTRAAALGVGGLAVLLARGDVFFDTTYYAHWAHGALTGSRVPYRDFAWEYPPGALPVMLLPGLYAPLMRDGHGSAYLWVYGATWVLSMLVVDGVAYRALLLRSGGDPRHPAARLWLWGLPLLGALSWARYDLLPAVAAGAALLAAGSGRAGSSGVLSGVGASLKLWPALLAPVQRGTRQAGGAVLRAGGVVVGTAGLTWALTGSTGFGSVLTYQRRRGLQCESLTALPLLWLRHLHLGGYRTQFRYGAWEVTGPHVATLAAATSVAFGAGLLALLVHHGRLLRHDGTAGAAALTSVAVLLLALATNKVFSPQYLLWLLGVLAAAAVLDPVAWRPFVPWALLACGLTAVAFPWYYGDVLGDGWVGLAALTARDAVVLGLAVAAGRQVLRPRRAGRGTAASYPGNAPVPR